MRQFFLSGPRTGARGKNEFPQTTGLRKGQYWSGVSSKKLFFSIVFLNKPITGALRHDFKTFRANI